ncbi:TetR family transcriptional regulator C-terminal domain-containing protein [Streptantibioticus silvisoli]|uniref:TetR family transcriptional regulator C-terminal domain-containing protein n=1 Tax=Streptantibioticus silvisoli TaxID=2705255 RepID=UPI0035589DF2
MDADRRLRPDTLLHLGSASSAATQKTLSNSCGLPLRGTFCLLDHLPDSGPREKPEARKRRLWGATTSAARLRKENALAGGCPIGSLGSEPAGVDAPAREDEAAGFARWERSIRDGPHAIRDRGELRRQAAPTASARRYRAGAARGPRRRATRARAQRRRRGRPRRGRDGRGRPHRGRDGHRPGAVRCVGPVGRVTRPRGRSRSRWPSA